MSIKYTCLSRLKKKHLHVVLSRIKTVTVEGGVMSTLIPVNIIENVSMVSATSSSLSWMSTHMMGSESRWNVKVEVTALKSSGAK